MADYRFHFGLGVSLPQFVYEDFRNPFGEEFFTFDGRLGFDTRLLDVVDYTGRLRTDLFYNLTQGGESTGGSRKHQWGARSGWRQYFFRDALYVQGQLGLGGNANFMEFGDGIPFHEDLNFFVQTTMELGVDLCFTNRGNCLDIALGHRFEKAFDPLSYEVHAFTLTFGVNFVPTTVDPEKYNEDMNYLRRQIANLEDNFERSTFEITRLLEQNEHLQRERERLLGELAEKCVPPQQTMYLSQVFAQTMTTNLAAFKPDATTEDLLQTMRAKPKQEFLILSHWSGEDTVEQNNVMSFKYAQFVRDYFLQRGIKPAQLKIDGKLSEDGTDASEMSIKGGRPADYPDDVHASACEKHCVVFEILK